MAGPKTAHGEVQRDRVLAFLRSYYREHGFAPQIKDFVDELGMSRTSVAWHLAGLRESRHVAYEDGQMARTLRPTRVKRPSLDG